MFCETAIFNFSASQEAAEIGGGFVILSPEGLGRRAVRAKFTNLSRTEEGYLVPGLPPPRLSQDALYSGAGF